jgi:Fe-S cluster assembly protein SufD
MNSVLNTKKSKASTDEPNWLTSLRQKGSDDYTTLPTPSGKDENWRFAKLFSTDIAQFRPAENVEESSKIEAIAKSTLSEESSGEMIYLDDHLIQKKELSEALKAQGVLYLSIEEAIANHSELLEPYFLKESTGLGSQKYFGLHASMVKAGSILFVPKGVEIKDPLVNYYWTDTENSLVFPHTLIVAEAHSKVSVIDVLSSNNPSNTALSISASNLYAHATANVFRKVVQNFNMASVSFQLDTTIADRDTTVKNIALNLGASKARFENQVKLNGSGAHVKMYSLTVAEGTQEFDQRTFQTHNAPNSVSDLLYKNALFDTSRTIFSGLIQVAEGAQQTDAYQTNRNLLLDPKADANSLPGLEILANDVKCSHGATTGNIDEEALFYMLSRGIPHRIAMQLIVLGFFEEIIDELESESLSKNIRAMLDEKFEKKIL